MVVNRNQPAKRFPLVQPLFHETYIQAMYRQKFTSDHWRRIDYAKPMIDDGPPHAVINPRLKLKFIQARGDRLARIEKDNNFMMRNILTTMRGPGNVDHYFKVPPQSRPHSLNFDNRKVWVRQVNADNKAMLKRLIQSRSVYDRIEMEKSYQHMIRSGRGRRYVFALWDAQRRIRRHWIMSGKCEHTNSGTVTNMESLRARTAATHRRCFEATDVEPFHHTEIPERCRSLPGAHLVDHKRCFHDPPDKPFVRAAPLCPKIMKRSPTYPIPLTRAHRLRLQANKEWIKNFLQELALHEVIQKKVMNTNTNQTDKEENLNQSASCSYSRNCRESSKDSPYRENLHLDKLASVALPPIANSSKTSPTKEEAAAVSESVKESNKLPKLPSSKLSKEVGAFRPCALRVGDTSIIAPCWRPVISSCHKAAPPQQQQHHNTTSRMSQLGKSLCDVYAKNVKRSTVTSLPSITATVSKVGSKMSRASDSVSSTKSVKLSPLGPRARKNSADTENSQDGTETAWERKTLTTRDSKKFWSDVASEKDRRVSCTMERQHRPEHWDIVESSKTRSTAGRRNSSEPRKNQKGSGDKTKPLSENNLTKRVLEPLRAKGSPRNTSLESLERDKQTRPYFSVKRSLLSDLEYSNEHFSVLPPCSDASFSSRSRKKKGDRRRESELPVLKSDNPHPKTSFRNEDRKDPEPSSRPVPCASNPLRSQPSPTPDLPEEAGSNRHPDSCAECLELGAEQNTSTDSELQDSVISDVQDSVISDVQDSVISEEETPRKDEQESSENSLTTDPDSKGGEVANWPSPANDATHSMVTGGNQCRLADLGVLHSRGQQTPTCSTQRGTKLDRFIFSDDSSEECVDGTSLYSDED